MIDQWNKIEVQEQTQTYVIIKYMERRFKSVTNHYENNLYPHHILYNKINFTLIFNRKNNILEENRGVF